MTDIITIIVLIILNGLFSMSEIALVSVRKTKLSTEAKKGSRGAKIALQLIEDPDKFLSTVQVGITLIGILTGLFSGSAFANSLGDYFCELGISDNTAHQLAQILIVAVVTYLSIVIGELIPKRIGISKSEKIAIRIAPVMKLLSTITLPVIWLLSASTNIAVKLFEFKDKSSMVNLNGTTSFPTLKPKTSISHLLFLLLPVGSSTLIADSQAKVNLSYGMISISKSSIWTGRELTNS